MISSSLSLINTAYIERLNAIFRTWLSTSIRRSRTLSRWVAKLEAIMFWMGIGYNFCWLI